MIDAKLPVKGILFDLDGTILDARPAYLEAGKITFETMRQQIPEYARLLEIPKRLELKQPLDDIAKTDTRKFLELYLKTFYTIAAAKTIPVPRAKETLEALSDNFQFAIITMRFMPKEVIAAELKRYGLDPYFTHIITALDTPKPKPSPQALIKAISAMHVQMRDCVVVGDSVVDVLAGKAAGAKTISVLSGLYSHAELSEAAPNFIINDISDLPYLVK
jgi:phosphoglycolate phosphatase